MKFKLGERVAYYPASTSGDRIHHDAIVVGHSKTGRPRIEFEVLRVGKIRKTVTARTLFRQERLAL